MDDTMKESLEHKDILIFPTVIDSQRSLTKSHPPQCGNDDKSMLLEGKMCLWRTCSNSIRDYVYNWTASVV